MNPFKFEDVLMTSQESQWHMLNLANQIPIIFSDNALVDYTKIREILINSPAPMWKHHEGGKNFVDYYDCRHFLGRAHSGLQRVVKNAIKHFFVSETEQTGDMCSNWFKQINTRRSEFAVPHSDHDSHSTSFTVIVYLNNEEECSGGTAFLRHRKSGKISLRYHDFEKFYDKYPDIIENGFDYWCDEKRSEWDIVGSIDMKPGRVIVFPSEFFHAAFHPQDSFYEFSRITLVHWQKVVDKINQTIKVQTI